MNGRSIIENFTQKKKKHQIRLLYQEGMSNLPPFANLHKSKMMKILHMTRKSISSNRLDFFATYFLL